MSRSRRNRPELPPSSVTVTIAVISICWCPVADGVWIPGAYRFSPERIVERPVPPPIETMRRGPFAALNRDRFVGRTITAY